MADLQKTIQIIFGGEDNVSHLTKNIDKSLGGLADSAETATQPLANLAINILAVETAIAAMGLAALNYAHNEAVAMESAQADLQKVLSDSEGSASDYKDEIKQLALEFGVAGVATTQTTADFKQAGFSIEESLGLVDTALTGVKIAELEASESGELLIRNIRGIGAEADDAAHFMDAWNEVSNEYAATAKEVAIATGALSPIAKTAGLSFDELVGLVTPLIEVYGSGAEAANALKVGLANLISPTARVINSLDELGIAQRDANGELRLSSDILGDLGELWPTLTESQQANFGILLFGKEQYARMSVVLNDYEKVLEITTVAENAAGSAKLELAVKLGTAEVAADRFATAMGFAADSVGQNFLDSSTKGTNALTNLAASFSNLVDDGQLSPLFEYLNQLLDEFAINVDIIAKNLPEAFDGVDYSGLIQSFRNIGIEFGDIFGDVDLTSAEGLQKVIQGIVDGLATLNDVFAGIVSGFSPVIEAFKSIAGAASESESGTAKFIGELIGTGAAINTFAGLLGGITTAFGALADAVILTAGANRLGLLPASFGAVGTASTTLISKLGPLGIAFAGGLGIGNLIAETTPLKGVFTDLFSAIDRLVGGPLSRAEEEMNKYSESTKKAADSMNQQVDAVEGVNDAHVRAFEEATKYDGAVNDLSESTELSIRINSEMELSQARLALQMTQLGLNIDGTKFSIEESGKVTKVASGEFEGWYKVLEDGVEVFYKTRTAAEGVSNSVDKVADSEKKLAEDSKKAAEAAEKLKLEYEKLEVSLEEIASNERIKTMEFFVELETAKVEADAEKVVAAFESISESYAATSELIGSLYGSLSDLSRSDQIDLERSIRKAEDLAQEQWETQKKLIEAQIEQIEASTARSKSGDALITVDGGELQPELEAIMQSLFKSIRIKMSDDYENFLLGLSA